MHELDDRQHSVAADDGIPPGPGQELRRAREARGLTPQEAAANLNLPTRSLEALENDDFDSLPSPIYIRGYLRNYAKLLQLDADTLVAAYDDSAGHDPQLTPPIHPTPQASSSDKSVKAMTYLLSLTLVLLLLAWWQSRHLGPVDDMSDLLADSTPSVVTSDPRNDSDSDEVLMPGFDYPLRVVRHPDSPVPIRPEATVLPTEPVGVPAESADQETLAVLQPIDGAPAPAEEPDARSGIPDNESGLRLELSAESWIEIYDADGNRLYHGLGRPGETLQFEGETPLQVLLGYAPGVRVSYGGEEIETGPHSSAGVARFEIGD